MRWNWELPDWPNFTFDAGAIDSLEARFLHDSGQFEGAFLHVSEAEQDGLRVELITEEAMKTSRIEGEILDRDSVQSSVRKNLGLLVTAGRSVGAEEKGVADMLVDSYRTYAMPLSDSLLCQWHRLLQPRHQPEHDVGAYRTGGDPMQIVSGDPFDPDVRFEAPPCSKVADEMRLFTEWFNSTGPQPGSAAMPALARAALAHLRFESIHPFADGNGRVGRALAEKSLSQAAGRPLLASLSQTIETRRKAYYEQLGKTRFTNQVTEWVVWFAEITLESMERTLNRVKFLIKKTRFFDRYDAELNAKQRKVLLRMFREGPEGFRGGLSSANYTSIAAVSPATARRHLSGLVKAGALTRTGQKKGTRYHLALDDI